MRTYECVGGSRDGSVLEIDVALEPGDIVPLCEELDGAAEHYKVSRDGRLHFSHYGPVASAEKLQPLMPRIERILVDVAAGLRELDTLIESSGSGLPPFQLGAWHIERR